MTRHLHIVREIVVTPMGYIYFDTKDLRIRVKHHQSLANLPGVTSANFSFRDTQNSETLL